VKETYYSVEQISQMLSIHPKTVQRYIREGKMRAAKIGKSWRVSGPRSRNQTFRQTIVSKCRPWSI
jgi:excisionase family DNA binding protein